jgi:hypothetical protein
MREAVLTADLDQLLATIAAVQSRDPVVANALRRMAESYQYQQLLEVFGAEVPV